MNPAYIVAALLDEAVNPAMLTAPERRKINNALRPTGLDGNGRFDGLGRAISAANNAMSPFGISTDMVTGDLLLGDQGSRVFTLIRTFTQGAEHEGQDPVELKNSRLSFSWYKMNNGYEVVAYAS